MSVAWFVVFAFAFVFALLGVAFAASAGNRRRIRHVNEQLRGRAKPYFWKARLMSISVPCETSLQFSIRAEDARIDRMRQNDELSEQQTGDFAFDRSMYIESEDARVGAWLRRDADARTLITALVGKKREVLADKGRLALGSTDLLVDGGDLPGQAERLHRLAALVPRTSGADPVSAPHRSRLSVLRGVSYAVLVVGLLAACVGWSDLILNPFPQHPSLTPLLLGAALLGAALATPVYLLVLRAARETSQVPRLRHEFFVSIWVPIVGITMVAAHQYNLKAIVDEEHFEEAEVAGLYKKNSRSGYTSHFMLPALRAGMPAAHYDSTREINERLREGQPVRVYWRKAPLFGFLLTRPPEPIPGAGR